VSRHHRIPGPSRPHRRSPARAAAGLLLAAAPLLLSGCLILPAGTRAQTGSLLPEERLATLRAGTSRREVLDWFGPPLAVVRRGAGVVRVPEVSLRTSGVEEVAAARFFERFADQAASPDDVVYFYRAHQLVTIGSGVVLILGNKGDIIGSSRDEHRDQRLWVLLDGARGVVRAHLLERTDPAPPVTPPSSNDVPADWGQGVPR